MWRVLKISFEFLREHIQENEEKIRILYDKIIDRLSDDTRLDNAPLNQLSGTLETLIKNFGKEQEEQKNMMGTLVDLFKEYKEVEEDIPEDEYTE